MARKNRTPEEKARREKIRELLQMANIGSMDDIQNLFKETIAEFMENGLEAELEDELGYSRYDYRNKATDNSRNGHSSKTLRTSFGDVEVSVPRDRKGEFEPQVLKKNQTSISQDIEEKILSMYAKGMTTGDIEAHIQDIYGICVSDSTVSRITDKILPIVREWQQRPLEGILHPGRFRPLACVCEFRGSAAPACCWFEFSASARRGKHNTSGFPQCHPPPFSPLPSDAFRAASARQPVPFHARPPAFPVRESP